MKRMLFAGTVALLAASPAFAADLPQAGPPPAAPAYVAPPALYNWGGIYVGVNGGYAFGNSEWSPPGTVGTGNFDLNGGLAGATIGINFQTGEFVFGLEGDGDWTNIKGSTTNTTTCFGVSCTFQTSNEWLSTFRARVGYAFDRVLLYGTAGGAAGDVKSQLTNPVGAFSASSSSTEFGWAAGAGVEFALTENITAKAEYLFVDLANGTFSCPAGICTAAATTVPVSFDASLIRAGLNFKFNPF